MASKVLMGFESESVSIAVRDILPLRQISAATRSSRKYRQIATAIRKAGIAQPPVVSRHPTFEGKYLLLEGHLRIEALKELGIDEVTCLVSLDDEAFTYNRQVNRLATIQEHKMILKLVERGVPEERIAETLDVNVHHIRAKKGLLHGICPEAAELLKDKHCPINTFRSLSKMKPLRQVEAAELMMAMSNYTIVYAKALLAATPPDQRADDATRRTRKGVSPEQLAQMEREMANLQSGIKRIEASYGPDYLHLILTVGYVRSLLGNDAIARHLDKHHPEIREEFGRICDATAIGTEAV